jgi:arylsulfatase A-like enzyme/predicted Zn-dependent protease
MQLLFRDQHGASWGGAAEGLPTRAQLGEHGWGGAATGPHQDLWHHGKGVANLLRKQAGFCFFLISTILVLVFFTACRSKDDVSRPTGRDRPNVLLISVDTLRADRLGCYGYKDISTPVIDGMAARGLRFEKCISQTPLTLPSHTTMLSGTYPAYHGVRDNGGFLVPQDLDTLAEVFKQNGFRTGAAVGAYVLDSKWGLNQGFDFYYDRFDVSRKEGFSMADVQRRGEEVIDQALDWLGKNKNEQFFFFAHLYDPHTPYDPPDPYREQYSRDLYAGEIAYVDSQLGRLWDFLKAQRLLERTMVVFTSDHGESLGEHGEETHGFFIYQGAVEVPLIIVPPRSRLRGKVLSPVVSLADLMPTILDLAGLPVPRGVQGRSLVPLFRSKDNSSTRPSAYSETFYPRFHYGWNEIQSIQDNRFKLILSPQPELYDLLNDPREAKDLAGREPAVVRQLEKRLREVVRDTGQNRFQMDYGRVDEETREKLASLGYIGTFVDTAKDAGRPLASPRDKIQFFNQISTAKELSLEGKLPEAERIMRGVIGQEPEIIDAYFILGNICFKQKRYPESIRCFSAALDRKPDYDFVVLNMAISYIEMQDLRTAEKVLADFVGKFPADSILYLTLGDINIKQEDYPEAARYFQECLRLNPNSAAAVTSLARLNLILDKIDQARAYALQALELNPQLKNVHYNLAQVYQAQGRTAEAEAEYKAELEFHPDNFSASFNLALLYRQKGDGLNEERYLLQARDGNPEFPLSHIFLGELYFQGGGRDEQAIALLERGVSLDPDLRHLKLAYYLLAKIYLRRGDQAQASRYARMIQRLGD